MVLLLETHLMGFFEARVEELWAGEERAGDGRPG